MNKINVLVDDRERELIEFLNSLDVEHDVERLEVGDVIINGEVVIERKTSGDFVSSLLDGRLFGQIKAMNENFERPLIIIEGSSNEMFGLRNIHRNALLGLQVSIALKSRIPVMFSKDITETANIIKIIVKQIENPAEQKLRIKKPQMTEQEEQQFIIEGLPLIGPKTARSLLEKFGSVKGVLTASVEELQEVDKIGKKKAENIVELLEKKYKKKKGAKKQLESGKRN